MEPASYTYSESPKLIKGSLGLMFSSLLFALSSYLVIAFITRISSVESYGRYAVAVSLLAWLEVITGQSFRLQALQSSAGVGLRTLKNILIKQGVFTVLIALLLLTFAGTLARMFGDRELVVGLRFAAFDLLPFSLFASLQGALNGLERYRELVWSRNSYALSKVVCMVGVVVVTGNAESALLGMAVASTISLALTFYIARGALLGSMPRENRLADGPGVSTKISLAYSVSQGFLLDSDLWISKFLFAPGLVGQYAALRNIGKVIFILSQALTAPLIPRLIRSRGFLPMLRADRESRQLIAWLIGLGVLALVAGCVFPETIIGLLFGEKYLAVASQLKFFLPAILLLVVGAFSSTVNLFLGQERMATILSVLAGVVLILVAVLFRSSLGLQGVFLGIGFSALVLLLPSLMFLFKRFGNP